MDYLYINGVVNETYKDMPCGCPFPEIYRKVLHATVAAQDWKNPRIPRVLSCFTLRTNSEKPVIVLSSVQRHEATASVARMIQCDGWQWQPDLLRGQLDQILHAGFYSEQEVIEQGKRFALPKDRHVSYDAVPIEMSAKVKEAILTTVFLRWMRYDPALRIAVPKGVDYESYVISAVKAIYGMFPLGLRLRAGFCSYMPEDEPTSEYVSIGFVPEDMADSRTLFLDGSSAAVCQSLCCGTYNNGLDTLIQYLAHCSDDVRTAFLEEVFREMETGGESEQLLKAKPNDYAVLGVALNLLSLTGSLRELMPRWKKDFLDDPERYAPSMRRRIQQKIHDTIDPAQFCAIAAESWGRSGNDIFTSLKSCEPYCRENQLLKDALWETMLTHMSAKKSYGEIYQLVTKRERDLAFLMDSEKKDQLFCNAKNEIFQTLLREQAKDLKQIESLKAKVQVLRTDVEKAPQTQNTEDLLVQIDRYLLALDKQYSDLCFRQLAERFETIRNMPNQTVQQVTKQLESAKDVLLQLDKLQHTPDRDELRAAAQQFASQLEAFLRSSDAKFALIREILSSNHGYFAILEELNQVDKSHLEEAELQEIAQQLALKRPNSLELYEAEFSRFYQKPMILSSIAKLADYVCGWVIRDICQLDKIHLHCSVSSGADATAQRIEGAMCTAGKISEHHKVFTTLGSGKQPDATWLVKSLRLKHNSRSIGNEAEFKDTFKALVQGGAFTGDDMIPAVEMYRRCGLKFTPLFEMMIQGCFREATEEQYQLAYKLIVDYSNADKAKVLENMQNCVDQALQSDKLATRAFQEFVNSQKRPQNGGKRWMIVSIVLAVLTVALVAAVLILALKPAPQIEQPVPPTTVATIPTEPEVVIPQLPEDYSYAMNHANTLDLLYGQDGAKTFEEHWSNVEDVLDNYVGDDLMTKFLEKKGTTLKLSTDVEVSWAEYLFWVCRNSAEDGTTIPTRALSENDSAVMDILEVIHPVMSNQHSQQFADTSEPEETSEILEEDTQVEEQTEVVDLTLDDIKTAVYEAAKDAYLDSVALNQDYLLMLRLLGTNYSMDFATISDGVEQWLLELDSVELRKHYAALPGTATVSPDGTAAVVTWNEYVFWECWYLKNYCGGTIEQDSFNADLQYNVARILNVIHCLGGEDVQRQTAEYPVEADIDLYLAIVSYAQASFEMAQQDCMTAYALTEVPEL